MCVIQRKMLKSSDVSAHSVLQEAGMLTMFKHVMVPAPERALTSTCTGEELHHHKTIWPSRRKPVRSRIIRKVLHLTAVQFSRLWEFQISMWPADETEDSGEVWCCLCTANRVSTHLSCSVLLLSADVAPEARPSSPLGSGRTCSAEKNSLHKLQDGEMKKVFQICHCSEFHLQLKEGGFSFKNNVLVK